MPRGLSARKAKLSVPVEFVDQSAFAAWRSRQSRRTRAWLDSSGFKATPGSRSLLAAPTGELERVFAGTAQESLTWDAAALAENLPTGNYRLVGALGRDKATAAAFGWALGAYRFETYKTGRKSAHQRPRRKSTATPLLAWPDGADRKMVERWVAGTFLVRDLVNTPAGDMDPAALAAAVRRIARLHKATCNVIVGDKLRQRNFPMIHAVGRASDRAPRLIDLRWGRRTAPRVTIVGKGVCFDSGGLDLKSADGMILMKKTWPAGPWPWPWAR